MKMKTEFGTDDIAKCLCKLGQQSSSGDIYKDSEEALFRLQCICENKYNFDFYRTLWNLLQDVAYQNQRLIYCDE